MPTNPQPEPQRTIRKLSPPEFLITHHFPLITIVLIAAPRLEITSNTTKQTSVPISNRLNTPVFTSHVTRNPLHFENYKLEMRSSGILIRWKETAPQTEVITEVRRHLKSYPPLLRRNRLRRDRAARPATSAATSTRTTASAGPATSARPAPALTATAAATLAAARAASVTTAALAAATATAACMGRHRIGRIFHATCARLAKRIYRSNHHKHDHCDQQRVFSRVLARFVPPEPLEECPHDSAFDSRGLEQRIPRTAFNLYSPFSRELQPADFNAANRIRAGLSVFGTFVLGRMMRWLGVMHATLVRIFLLMMKPLRGSARRSGLRYDRRRKRQSQNQRCDRSSHLHLRPPFTSAPQETTIRNRIKKLQCPPDIVEVKLPPRLAQHFAPAGWQSKSDLARMKGTDGSR